MHWMTILVLITVLLGCESKPEEPIEIKAEAMETPADRVPTPEGCPPSKEEDGICRGSDGTFQLPECCGLKRL